MRQSMAPAPAERILIVGNGRLATFLQGFLNESLSHLPTQNWSRSHLSAFHDSVRLFSPTHIWLCLSDDSIETFCLENSRSFHGRTVVHFAGAKGCLELAGHTIYPAHPLMSFPSMSSAEELKAQQARFKKVSFAVSPRQPVLQKLMPGLDNPSFVIEDDLRPLYHAYCSLVGNVTVLLWEEIENRWQRRLGTDIQHLDTFKNQIFEMLSAPRDHSILTGPMARGDIETLRRQKQALNESDDPELSALIDIANSLYKARFSDEKRL